MTVKSEDQETVDRWKCSGKPKKKSTYKKVKSEVGKAWAYIERGKEKLEREQKSPNCRFVSREEYLKEYIIWETEKRQKKWTSDTSREAFEKEKRLCVEPHDEGWIEEWWPTGSAAGPRA